MIPATVNDRRIADLNGLIDMMRENAVDREKGIAELEADNRILTAELRGYFQQYGWESTGRILKYHGQPREGCEG